LFLLGLVFEPAGARDEGVERTDNFHQWDGFGKELQPVDYLLVKLVETVEVEGFVHMS
jgi:hypothetical protein